MRALTHGLPARMCVALTHRMATASSAHDDNRKYERKKTAHSQRCIVSLRFSPSLSFYFRIEMTSEPQMERNRRAHILSNWNKPAMNESLLAFSGYKTVVAVRLKMSPRNIESPPSLSPRPLPSPNAGRWWWWSGGGGENGPSTVRTRTERLAEAPRRLQAGRPCAGGRVRGAGGRRWERSGEKEKEREREAVWLSVYRVNHSAC